MGMAMAGKNGKNEILAKPRNANRNMSMVLLTLIRNIFANRNLLYEINLINLIQQSLKLFTIKTIKNYFNAEIFKDMLQLKKIIEIYP